MKALTEDDWNEIYYALEDKKRSPACAGDWRWTAHIDSILEKIGHDGVFASREGSDERLIAAAPDLLEAAKGILGDTINPIRVQDGFEECGFCGRVLAVGRKNCEDDDCPSTALRAAITASAGVSAETTAESLPDDRLAGPLGIV
tara:strand:+ start:746 stop:1180 length:435 start_codon:yes stop_codon:yes gene_type:complete